MIHDGSLVCFSIKAENKLRISGVSYIHNSIQIRPLIKISQNEAMAAIFDLHRNESSTNKSNTTIGIDARCLCCMYY